MKAHLYTEKGEKKGQIDLPEIFSKTIRDDIFSKAFEAEKFCLRQLYSTYEEAGKRHSASGRIRHHRNVWRSGYGKGISRVPRKTMWRRGTQFLWIGAEASPMRGGRTAHPPQGIYAYRKINSKEEEIAFASGFAATFSHDFISKRYSTLTSKVTSAVIEAIPGKTKELIKAIENIFQENKLTLKVRKVRAGKGKTRGRKYKSNAGVLIIAADNEKYSHKGFDIKPFSKIVLKDLAPLGRLTLYTKKAIEQMEGKNAA